MIELQPLGRGLMEYSDGYHGHAPDPALASQQAGMASMDGLPLMSPTHPLHTDPHGQAFSHISLLNSGNAAHKSLSASLDSVPMGLGPPGMMSHPNYGSVASYISSTPMAKGATASSSPATTVTRPPPQKSQSAQHAGQNKSHKKRRTRTSSMTSSSSIASSGIMSSITSTLGATNISSFTDSPSGINSAQHHHHHHSSSSVPNLSVPPSILGGPDFSNESGAGGSGNMAFHGLAAATGSNAGSSTASSPTSGKPRPGGHPRTAVAARVFECSFPGCNKAYTQLHNLKSHERTGHTPIQKPRPFLCIIPGCTKAFSQRKSLALHIRASHKEYKFKPFKCSQQGCDKSYTQLHNLRTHEKTVHMLDLSRKRIRNPLPYPGTEGGGSAGGGGMDGMQGDGSSMMMVGLQGSSSGDRDQFPGGVGLSYESIDDLKDFSGARMPGHAENEERGSGQYQRGGGNGGGGRDELADVEEEEDDGDYIDE
ncbi:hypothetical protein BGX33_001083 [Mortierella sp. NVP41]|nr:hypothetical protein BGX33_001083 [Mortierella sp. NVP41]